MRAAPLRIVDQEVEPVGDAARVLDGEAEGEQFLHRTRGPFDVWQTGREPNSGRCGARRR
ncbi:hypothetical protein ABZ918_11260 [Streptomyces viridosporus]|uniref:hypothetical protein n=1 Tax=Streptomyces viridosporus TaxID=67581 RepID=UPI0034280D97